MPGGWVHAKYQRGALSLFWTAVVAGVIALVGVLVLMSMRYERNLFVDIWRSIVHTDTGKNLRQAAERASRTESTTIRQCIVDGKTVYSNVECDSRRSRKLELRDTQGIEPPKVAPAPQADMPSLQEKMIEKAVQR